MLIVKLPPCMLGRLYTHHLFCQAFSLASPASKLSPGTCFPYFEKRCILQPQMDHTDNTKNEYEYTAFKSCPHVQSQRKMNRAEQ
jgi:hypothetical protein